MTAETNGRLARIGKALCGLVAALVVEGCAEAPPPSKPAVVFPTRAELAAIPAAKPKLEAFGEVDTSTEPWDVQVEASTQGTPYVDASIWGDFLRAEVSPHGRTVALSAPLKCAATELAKVGRRSPKLLPPMNLMRFIIARCGAVVSAPHPIVWRVETTGSPTDDMILDAAKKQLAPAIEKTFVQAGAQDLVVGLGVAQDEKGASVVVMVADNDVALDPGPLRADANHLVTIRGTARGDFESITALVNQGPLGFAKCVPQGALPPPLFAFTCRLADADPYAWVELLGQRKGLVLEREIAVGIVTAAGDTPIVYKPRSDAAATPVKSAAELSTAILDGVNRARRSARLSPLVLDPKQSVENTRLVGTLVNATFDGEDPAASDKAAIGLLAGWDVAGMIRGGTIFVAALGATHDATAWLDWAFERPSGRETLLDPASRVIAIGPAVPDEGAALGAAVTTYALFESNDHSPEEAAVFQRIEAARAAKGLPAAIPIAGFPEMHERALHVLDDAENPLVTLRAMLSAATVRTGSSALGYVLETTDIDHFELPENVMRPGAARVAIAVTHHRAEGAAWGQYVVFVVTVGDYVAAPGLEARNVRPAGTR